MAITQRWQSKCCQPRIESYTNLTAGLHQLHLSVPAEAKARTLSSLLLSLAAPTKSSVAPSQLASRMRTGDHPQEATLVPLVILLQLTSPLDMARVALEILLLLALFRSLLSILKMLKHIIPQDTVSSLPSKSYSPSPELSNCLTVFFNPRTRIRSRWLLLKSSGSMARFSSRFVAMPSTCLLHSVNTPTVKMLSVQFVKVGDVRFGDDHAAVRRPRLIVSILLCPPYP